MATDEAWTTVASKRGRAKRLNRPPPTASARTPPPTPPPPTDDGRPADPAVVALTRRRVDAALPAVAELAFTAALLAAVCAPFPVGGGELRSRAIVPWRELVAYGVGPVAASARARVQFAAAELLRRRLGVRDAWWFDPACSAEDVALVESYGWQLIDADEEAKRAVAPAADDNAALASEGGCEATTGDEAPQGEAVAAPAISAGTVFFMPHCPFRLYSNVLWKNWPVEPTAVPTGSSDAGGGASLLRCCVVGNSFDAYDRRTVGAAVAASNCVLRLLPYTHEAPLSAAGRRDAELLSRHGVGPEALGDLAVMRWEAGALEAARAAGALEPPPPEEFGVSHGT